MISSVSGELRASGSDWVEIELGGALTLRINAPSLTVESLGKPGDRARLFTYLAVREDDLSLYGFDSEESRSAFEALIGISGVGPRVALSILSTLRPESLAAAIAGGDVSAFRGVHGVGKKTASRIVLELAGKLELFAAPSVASGSDQEVEEALMAAGLGVLEAREAATNLSYGTSESLEDRVREAFQRIGSE